MPGFHHRPGCACDVCSHPTYAEGKARVRRTDPAVRFWARVDKSGECWRWTGAIGKPGYGNFWDGTRYMNAHRFALESVVGPLPFGAQACHRCDNRWCVRPDHLFVGSAGENMRDAVNKGRMRPWHAEKTECKRGHPLSGANLHIRASDGGRICKTCRRDRDREVKRQLRAARKEAA